MTRSNYRAIVSGSPKPRRTVLVFLNPDVVVASDCFTRAHDLIVRGYKAIMVAGLRMHLDEVAHKLLPYYADGRLIIPPPELARMAIECLHPCSEVFVWNRGLRPVNWHPLLLYETPRGDLLQHCFHLHPLFLVTPDELPDTPDTIDGKFMEQCRLSADEFHVVTDDNIVVAEISGGPYAFPDALGPPSRARIADFAVRWVSDIHWDFFKHRISYLQEPATPQASPELDRLVRYVLTHKPRRWFARNAAWLDRRVLRHLFRALAALRCKS